MAVPGDGKRFEDSLKQWIADILSMPPSSYAALLPAKETSVRTSQNFLARPTAHSSQSMHAASGPIGGLSYSEGSTGNAKSPEFKRLRGLALMTQGCTEQRDRLFT